MARPRIGEERREQILKAFETCVVRKGLAKTTLADVADEAGSRGLWSAISSATARRWSQP